MGRVHELGLPDIAAYVRRVQQDQSGQEMILLLDAIATKVTSFFRESCHFVEADLRSAIVREFTRLLKTGGVHFTGQGQSLVGLNAEFRMLKPSIYVKNG